MSRYKILVADDEARMRRLVKDFLGAAGCDVIEAGDGEQAMELFIAEGESIDLVVLDVMMPKMNGWEVCRELRRVSKVPIIMLTALSQESDEITGFDMGADEYITKPFSPRVFVARAEALLRRSGSGGASHAIDAGGIVIDTVAHTVRVDGEEVYLSLKEYDLLLYLVENRGQTLSREKILNSVWDYDYFGDARTIDTHITKLRKKLGPYGDKLQTVRGIGYKFEK
ncbi:MAG: response regulator transcription factor [Oscillospiraceae bacterium]|nr:response regulator transcription factor [Oscillospiraceae bacterium]